MPQTYFTFARTLPPSSKISKSVMALLEKFAWNKFIIIVGRRNEWIQIKDAIKVKQWHDDHNRATDNQQ